MIIPIKIRKRILTCKKRLISGNINTYTLRFDWDEEWEDFEDKRVTFSFLSTDGSEPVNIEVPLATNDVVVPWESIDSTGLLYITLKGVKYVETEPHVLITKRMDIPVGVDPHGLTDGDPSVDPDETIVDYILRRLDNIEHATVEFVDFVVEGNVATTEVPLADMLSKWEAGTQIVARLSGEYGVCMYPILVDEYSAVFFACTESGITTLVYEEGEGHLLNAQIVEPVVIIPAQTTAAEIYEAYYSGAQLMLESTDRIKHSILRVKIDSYNTCSLLVLNSTIASQFSIVEHMVMGNSWLSIPIDIITTTNLAKYCVPKATKSTFENNSIVNLQNNGEYRGTGISEVTFSFVQQDDFECYILLNTASSGDINITFPQNTLYIGEMPVFGNGETWEISIKDRILVAGKVNSNA